MPELIKPISYYKKCVYYFFIQSAILPDDFTATVSIFFVKKIESCYIKKYKIFRRHKNICVNFVSEKLYAPKQGYFCISPSYAQIVKSADQIGFFPPRKFVNVAKSGAFSRDLANYKGKGILGFCFYASLGESISSAFCKLFTQIRVFLHKPKNGKTF